MKEYLLLFTALSAVSPVTATAQEDAVLVYWDSFHESTNFFVEKMQEAQPYLNWVETKDQNERDDIAWKMEYICNGLRKIKADFDNIPIPEGFGVSHGIISSAFDLYITGITRAAEGIRMNYTKIFNGGIIDIGTANDFMEQGYASISEEMAAAGYNVD